jgi:hypothetical protein
MTIRWFVFALVLPALSACGDHVLAGIVSSDGGSNPCASYVAGTRVQPGVSVADYCALVGRVCGFSEMAGAPPTYASLADCQAKYAAESENGRTCSAGFACEIAITGERGSCEAVVVTCAEK